MVHVERELYKYIPAFGSHRIRSDSWSDRSGFLLQPCLIPIRRDRFSQQIYLSLLHTHTLLPLHRITPDSSQPYSPPTNLWSMFASLSKTTTKLEEYASSLWCAFQLSSINSACQTRNGLTSWSLIHLQILLVMLAQGNPKKHELVRFYNSLRNVMPTIHLKHFNFLESLYLCWNISSMCVKKQFEIFSPSNWADNDDMLCDPHIFPFFCHLHCHSCNHRHKMFVFCSHPPLPLFQIGHPEINAHDCEIWVGPEPKENGVVDDGWVARDVHVSLLCVCVRARVWMCTR